MKIKIIFPIAFLLILISCKSKNGNAEEAKEDTAARFPLIELLKMDFDDVYKTPYYMYKTTVDLKTKKLIDSVFINRDDFKKIVYPILKADIGSKEAKKRYSETSYSDLSMQTVSIVVAAKEADMEVQNIAANYDDQKNRLRNATITLERKSNDTFITEKVFWKVNSNLTIATQKKLKDSVISETKTFVHWNVRQPQD